jgi:hypothetical protein
MRPSLFQRGLGPRLVATVLYGLVAFGAVSLLAPRRTGREGGATGEVPAPSTPVSPVTRGATLCLQSMRPVAVWEIRVDGVPVMPRSSDGTTWIAEVGLSPESSVVVDATPAGGEPAGRNALRIRIAGTPVPRDQTFWCERDWTVAAQAGRLAPSPTPIDPEDLP